MTKKSFSIESLPSKDLGMGWKIIKTSNAKAIENIRKMPNLKMDVSGRRASQSYVYDEYTDQENKRIIRVLHKSRFKGVW